MLPPAIALLPNPLWLQAAITWRLDVISVVIGLVLGLAVAYLLYRVRRGPRRGLQPTSAAPPPGPRHSWQRTTLEKRYHAEVARLARRRHLAAGVAPLEQLFVPPRLLSPAPPVHPERAPPLAATQLADLWPDLAARVAVPPSPTMSLHQLLLNGRRVVLSSPPGSGKSTLLAYCAYLCAQASPGTDYAFLLQHIAVLAHVADLDLGPGDVGDRVAAPLLRALHEPVALLGEPALATLVQEKLDAGHLLLLLDGWSEVSAETRAYAVSWLRRLLGRFAATKVFVASATQGFEPLLDLSFTLSGLAPWRAAEAHRLGQRWAALSQRHSPPDLVLYWQPHQSVLETTLRLWSQNADLRFAQGQLPALLASATAHFARQASSKEAPYDLLLHYWQALAQAALDQGEVDLTPALLQALAAEAFSNDDARAPNAGSDGAALSASLRQAPIFLPAAGRRLRFASPLWRDHLAAAHLARDAQPDTLRERLRDPGSAELLRQYAALMPLDDLATWMLDASTAGSSYDDLFTVASWLPVSRHDGAWRQVALLRLAQLVARPQVPEVQRLRAIAALGDYPTPAILELLRQLLQRSDPGVRQAAVAAVARFDAARSVPLLEDMLHDLDADVRVAAVHALGWLHHESAHHHLLLTLIGRDELMRYAAVEVLALDGPRGWRVLREAAVDDDIRVRRAATHALASIDQQWAAELLQQMETGDHEWLVRSAATRALETRSQRRRSRPWFPLQAADLDWMVQWSSRHNRSAPGGAAAVTLLCEMLSTAPEPAIREAAARALSQVAIPAEERAAVCAALWQATRSDGGGAVREAAHATLAFLQRVRGPQERVRSSEERGHGP